jgi:hypothetical protein
MGWTHRQRHERCHARWRACGGGAAGESGHCPG